MQITSSGFSKAWDSLPTAWRLLNIAFPTLIALFLVGCAAKRNHYDVPALDLPNQYAKAPTSDNVDVLKKPAPSPTTVLASPFSTALAEWWRLLGSDELNGLIDRALANNPDMRIATLRIAQTKARLDQAGSNKLPTISMPIQMNTSYPEFGVGRGNANGVNTARPLSQLSIQGNYRLDIWGETSSLYESAELQLLRTTYQRDDMQRTVVANVALSYMEYLSLNDRLRVARETEKSLAEMLVSVDARLEAGDATITEMEQQKAAVYSVKATIPLLEQQRNVVLNRLAGLLGTAPVALTLSDKGMDSAKFPSVLPGVPSALLLRRPDVRAAEARLLAADADIDVARTRVLPPLDLSAQAGYGSMYMSQLFMPQALFWNTLANLSVTIFDGGKLAKEVEFAKAMHEELLETYVRAIYDAVREVDDSLSGINAMSRRVEAQSIAADSSLRAWNYSQEVFMAGVVDYIVLLDTQRTYQLNMDNWYSFRLDSYRNLINLFSALGGGVSSGDVMPGKGVRPAHLANTEDYSAISSETVAIAKADTTMTGKNSNSENTRGENSLTGSPDAQPAPVPANRIKAKGVDWSGSLLHNGTHWLVELSGVYDRDAILPAWRDLRARFPQQLENRTLLPHRQGQITVADKERASWYRLFIATFSSKKMAEEYCAMLAAGQQRCSVVAADSLSGKGDFSEPATARQFEIAAAVAEVTATTTDKKDHTDLALVKDPQRAKMDATDPVATPTSSPELLIERWMKDWAAKNVAGYLSHYNIGFRPEGGKDHAAWEAERRQRISDATSIKVRVQNLMIEPQSERMATARFLETVIADHHKKSSHQKLLLIRGVQDNEWKIWEEKQESAADAKAARLNAKHTAKSTSPARQAGKQFNGMDWSGQQFWLVEMTDVYERNNITTAWRSLIAQFPEQMKNRTVLPRSRGEINDSGEKSANRYQLFIAQFPEQPIAEEFCAKLRAGQQHCSVISSQSFAEEDGLNAVTPTDPSASKGGQP